MTRCEQEHIQKERNVLGRGIASGVLYNELHAAMIFAGVARQ